MAAGPKFRLFACRALRSAGRGPSLSDENRFEINLLLHFLDTLLIR